MCDVPRTIYAIGGQEFGAATGEQAAGNVLEKKVRQLRYCVWLSPTATGLSVLAIHPMPVCCPPLTARHLLPNLPQAAVREMLESLLVDSDPQIPQLASNRDQLLEDYAQHVLNESCTTVTNTTAKTAVQLVFGKANLVLVRPSPASEDSKPVRIVARKLDSTLTITVSSSWSV